MSKPPAVLAERYGLWTVIGQQYTGPAGARVRCRCECGVEKDVFVGNLTRGGSLGCGCNKRRTTTHGESGTRLYIVWTGLRQRCNEPTCWSYKDYGGRGITVCPEWNAAYEPFRDWARANGWRHGLEIDRIDNDGNYCPENCHFVTRKENTRNRRVTVRLTAWGETKPLMAWVEDPRCVVSEIAVRCRLDRGWDHERALSELARLDPARDHSRCSHGHEMAEANTKWANGKPVCRACANERNARYYAKKHSA